MSIILGTGKFILKAGWVTTRFFVQHLVSIITIAMALIALGLGYRIWRIGIHSPKAILFLPPLVLCLILIILTLSIRRKIRGWVQMSIFQTKAAVQRYVVEGAVQEGIGLGGSVLKGRTETVAREMSTLNDKIKVTWERYVKKPGQTLLQMPCCPSCGRTVWSGVTFCNGCGKPLDLTCRHCGHTSGSQIKFCGNCGISVGS
jgi:hypothetical protein